MAMAKPMMRSLPEQWRGELILLLILASVQFFSIVDFMVVMPLSPQLEETLHISTFQFGLIVSSYTLSAGVAGLLGSSVLDRFGRKRAFLTLFIGFLVGTLLCGLSVNYATLLLARIVTGAFGGILGGMALAIIGDVFPEERRGQATGVLMSAFALASVVGVPICILLGDRFGWHVPFLVLAAVGLPFFLLAQSIMPPLRDHLEGRVHSHPWAQLRQTFSHNNHLRAFALTFVIMFGGFSVIPYISLYLVGNVGVTKRDLAWVYVAGGLLSLVGAPVIGRLADRFGKLTSLSGRREYRGLPDAGGHNPQSGAAGLGGRGGGGPHAQQCGSDGRGTGDRDGVGRAAPARWFYECQLGSTASGVWSWSICRRQDHRVGRERRATAFWQGRDHGHGGDLADALAGRPGAIGGVSARKSPADDRSDSTG